MRHSILILASVSLLVLLTNSCQKIEDLTKDPELDPLEHGFKISATIGYCVSIAKTALTGQPLPTNVTLEQRSNNGYSSSGVIHVKVNASTPLPFNTHVGDIYIAGLWNGDDGGVISILLADIDVVSSTYRFYGLYTVPISIKKSTGEITTVFAEQDIIIGNGSDTLLNLSLSKPKFDTELARLNATRPDDVFAAIKQNVWFITINQRDTPSDIYDDTFTVSGGGQIAEVKSKSGGILYHAMIDTDFSYSQCSLNPLDGTALIQNIKASGSSVDLGHITLDFHDECDGRADVKVATGKYITSNGKNINLHWN